jgi:hypothetical protein
VNLVAFLFWVAAALAFLLATFGAKSPHPGTWVDLGLLTFVVGFGIQLIWGGAFVSAH